MKIPDEECYATWAPDDSVWARWAKPVIFASASFLPSDTPLSIPTLEAPGLPGPADRVAIILDLPGEEAVVTGLALARNGFRPVPLFNGTNGLNPAVKTEGIVAGLGAGAAILTSTSIGSGACPVFLLDANRRGATATIAPGVYDNRWVVLPQDFPSGQFLQAQGIKEALLVQRGRTAPAEDLAHVLLRWQQAGIPLRSVDLATNTVVDRLIVTKPSMFRRAWYAAVSLMGLRRSNVGGFGATVPEQSGGTGHFG